MESEKSRRIAHGSREQTETGLFQESIYKVKNKDHAIVYELTNRLRTELGIAVRRVDDGVEPSIFNAISRILADLNFVLLKIGRQSPLGPKFLEEEAARALQSAAHTAREVFCFYTPSNVFQNYEITMECAAAVVELAGKLGKLGKRDILAMTDEFEDDEIRDRIEGIRSIFAKSREFTEHNLNNLLLKEWLPAVDELLNENEQKTEEIQRNLKCVGWYVHALSRHLIGADPEDTKEIWINQEPLGQLQAFSTKWNTLMQGLETHLGNPNLFDDEMYLKISFKESTKAHLLSMRDFPSPATEKKYESLRALLGAKFGNIESKLQHWGDHIGPLTAESFQNHLNYIESSSRNDFENLAEVYLQSEVLSFAMEQTQMSIDPSENEDMAQLGRSMKRLGHGLRDWQQQVRDNVEEIWASLDDPGLMGLEEFHGVVAEVLEAMDFTVDQVESAAEMLEPIDSAGAGDGDSPE